MPNQPATPTRSLRSPDDIWLPAQARANDEGRSMTEVVNELLKEYGKDYREQYGIRQAPAKRARRKPAAD